MNLNDLIPLDQTADSAFATGVNGVLAVKTTMDRKVEFVRFENGATQALVKSAMGYPAYYPVCDVKIEKPLKAVSKSRSRRC